MRGKPTSFLERYGMWMHMCAFSRSREARSTIPAAGLLVQVNHHGVGVHVPFVRSLLSPGIVCPSLVNGPDHRERSNSVACSAETPSSGLSIHRLRTNCGCERKYAASNTDDTPGWIAHDMAIGEHDHCRHSLAPHLDEMPYPTLRSDRE